MRRFREALQAIANGAPRLIAGRLGRMTTASKKTKTHTFFLLAGPYGAFAIVSARLPPALEKTYLSILRAAGDLWDKIPRRCDLPSLRADVVRAVCLVEKNLGAIQSDIKLHNMIHLVDAIENMGKRG